MPVRREDFAFRIEDRHFDFLSIQRGQISDLRHDRQAWEAAYKESIFRDYEEMLPWLPHQCSSILDIGSGLGGIDAVLNRHYGGGLTIGLLDGMADTPQVFSHDRTFNDFHVACDFLLKNGCDGCTVCQPELSEWLIRFDLVISLSSWCFHFPPEFYLSFVRDRCGPETVIITDVREGRLAWRQTMASAFTFGGNKLSENGKALRCMYVAG